MGVPPIGGDTVFPAYVGMSPPAGARRGLHPRVPRIRGDEPVEPSYTGGDE